MIIAVKYAIFAIIAMAVNIVSQDLSLSAYGGDYAVLLSVMVGTLTGLVAKYYLDKRYIFRYVTKSAVHDGKTFFLYTLMGVVTTAIFWGFEFSFDHWFGTKSMRYAGGLLGLAIGYYIKYQLDKRFVFVTE